LERLAAQHAEALRDQAILPTGTADLATPASRVFFPPMRAAPPASGQDDPQAADDTGEELSAIDDDRLRPLLRFFDDTAMTVRTGTSHDYTPLAQKLSEMGLVRRPRQVDLINDAVIPALRDSKHDSDQALPLLHQALFWLAEMPQKSRQQVKTDGLLVPTRGQGSAWEWVAPDQVYLGDGWEGGPGAALIIKAFGGRPASLLVPGTF
jgi:hypothetical protein